MHKTEIKLKYRKNHVQGSGFITQVAAGYEISIEGNTFVVHHPKNRTGKSLGGWQVSEPRTGLSFVVRPRKTKEQAVKAAEEFFKIRFSDLGVDFPILIEQLQQREQQPATVTKECSEQPF
jgi:hypothetical protein